jgi:hypothetical protein
LGPTVYLAHSLILDLVHIAANALKTASLARVKGLSTYYRTRKSNARWKKYAAPKFLFPRAANMQRQVPRMAKLTSSARTPTAVLIASRALKPLHRCRLVLTYAT